MARARSPAPQMENAIEPTALRQQPRPHARQEKRDQLLEGAIGAEGDPATTATRRRPADGALPVAAPRDTGSVPDSVRDRFLQIKEKWYFENGDLAFHDMGTKLSTKSEN